MSNLRGHITTGLKAYFRRKSLNIHRTQLHKRWHEAQGTASCKTWNTAWCKQTTGRKMAAAKKRKQPKPKMTTRCPDNGVGNELSLWKVAMKTGVTEVSKGKRGGRHFVGKELRAAPFLYWGGSILCYSENRTYRTSWGISTQFHSRSVNLSTMPHRRVFWPHCYGVPTTGLTFTHRLSEAGEHFWRRFSKGHATGKDVTSHASHYFACGSTEMAAWYVAARMTMTQKAAEEQDLWNEGSLLQKFPQF